MSIPVGHTLGGYAAVEAFPPRVLDRWWKAMAFAAVVANLPDVDFLPGLLRGRPGMYHRGATHTLLAAGAAATVGGLLFKAWKGRFGSGFLLTGAAYASHLLLDTVAPEDAGDGAGVPLLLPFTDERFATPVPLPDWVFEALTIHRSDGPESFLEALVGKEALTAAGTEAVLYLPLLLAGLAARKAWEARAEE